MWGGGGGGGRERRTRPCGNGAPPWESPEGQGGSSARWGCWQCLLSQLLSVCQDPVSLVHSPFPIVFLCTPSFSPSLLQLHFTPFSSSCIPPSSSTHFSPINFFSFPSSQLSHPPSPSYASFCLSDPSLPSLLPPPPQRGRLRSQKYLRERRG